MLTALLALAGCATTPPGPGAPVERKPSAAHEPNGSAHEPPDAAQTGDTQAADDPPASDIAAPEATLALRRDSHQAARSGEIARAVELLERAIRIDPTRATLWLELAELHRQAGRDGAAAQFARKALQLAAPGRSTARSAQQLIARIEAGRASR